MSPNISKCPMGDRISTTGESLNQECELTVEGSSPFSALTHFMKFLPIDPVMDMYHLQIILILFLPRWSQSYPKTASFLILRFLFPNLPTANSSCFLLRILYHSGLSPLGDPKMFHSAYDSQI